MHLASALGVPVLALFRVSNVSRYAPLSPGSRALLNPEGPDPGKAASAAAEILG
jgi:ADP-heptose:LPS heptosyltransferase